MGNFMIPACCICGNSSPVWHDKEWEDKGGLQDFCPEHSKLLREKYGEFVSYLAPHMMEKDSTNNS